GRGRAARPGRGGGRRGGGTRLLRGHAHDCGGARPAGVVRPLPRIHRRRLRRLSATPSQAGAVAPACIIWRISSSWLPRGSIGRITPLPAVKTPLRARSVSSTRWANQPNQPHQGCERGLHLVPPDANLRSGSLSRHSRTAARTGSGTRSGSGGGSRVTIALKKEAHSRSGKGGSPVNNR